LLLESCKVVGKYLSGEMLTARLTKERRKLSLPLVIALLCLASACQTLGPLPPVDLKEPGWTVREGQAVYRRNRTEPEIAGEILVATRPDGSSVVQFTKAPFPLMIARTTPAGWQVEEPARNRRYSGHGHTPGRILWLALPRALTGRPLPKDIQWRSDANGWHLENRQTGESLEGYLGSGLIH
jgi:hypothetical protein